MAAANESVRQYSYVHYLDTFHMLAQQMQQSSLFHFAKNRDPVKNEPTSSKHLNA